MGGGIRLRGGRLSKKDRFANGSEKYKMGIRLSSSMLYTLKCPDLIGKLDVYILTRTESRLFIQMTPIPAGKPH